MRKSIVAVLIALAAIFAGFAPAAANASVPRQIVWGVTGHATVVNPGTVNWPRKLFGTKAAADAYVTQVKTLEGQVCKLSPVSCASFVESPVIAG